MPPDFDATLPPKAGSAEAPPPDAPRPPRRQEIAPATVGVLRRSRGIKADVLVVDLGQGPLVVKDFAPRRWWGRLWGRLHTWYELKAYRRLGELEGIPRLIGRIDGLALAVEKVEGVQLTLSPDRYRNGAAYHAQIRGLIRSFLERGFAHLDIRGRRNVLLRDDGRVVAIDLAGSVWYRPGGPAALVLRPFVEWFYRSVELKWKALLTPDRLTEDDRARLRRFRISRRLWVFKKMRVREGTPESGLPAPGETEDDRREI